jgi:rubrerythrin
METRGKKIFEHFAEEERKHYESISRRAADMLVAT